MSKPNPKLWLLEQVRAASHGTGVGRMEWGQGGCAWGVNQALEGGWTSEAGLHCILCPFPELKMDFMDLCWLFNFTWRWCFTWGKGTNLQSSNQCWIHCELCCPTALSLITVGPSSHCYILHPKFNKGSNKSQNLNLHMLK